jgi:hypothetical protein
VPSLEERDLLDLDRFFATLTTDHDALGEREPGLNTWRSEVA